MTDRSHGGLQKTRLGFSFVNLVSMTDNYGLSVVFSNRKVSQVWKLLQVFLRKSCDSVRCIIVGNVSIIGSNSLMECVTAGGG